MEKKYYDLIVSLIKNHKKYPGCEAILDEIAKNVYNHAKVVIGTIDNDDVIESYLSKVVSTSIITVPKKLNINTRTSRRVAMPELRDPTLAVKNEIKIDVPHPKKNELPELVTEAEIEPQIKNDTANEVFDSSVPIEQDVFEELEQDDVLDSIQEYPLEAEIESVKEEDVETTTPIQEPELNEQLDKPKVEETEEMLDIEDFADIAELDTEDKPIEEVQPESLAEEITELDFETEPVIDVGDEIEDESTTPAEVMTSDEENEHELETLATTEDTEDIEPIESSEKLDVNKDLVDKMINNAESPIGNDNSADHTEELTEITELAEAEPAELVENELPTSDELFTLDEIAEEPLLEAPLDEVETLTEEISDSAPLLEEEGTVSEPIIESEGNDNSKEFTPPKYDCFNFEPEIDDTSYNSEDINDSLQELDTKHPEWNVLKICELKYKENKSVEEIAESLGMGVDEVLDTLSEIIFAIKD